MSYTRHDASDPVLVNAVMSFLYVHIDFFAASYLGLYSFNPDALPHTRPPLKRPLNETFFTWAKQLSKYDTRKLQALRDDLWHAVGHDENTWRSFIVGSPPLEDDHSLYFNKNINNEFEKYLTNNPDIIHVILKHILNPIIDKWYQDQGDLDILLRRLQRFEQEQSYLIVLDNEEKNCKSKEKKLMPFTEDTLDYRKQLYQLLYRYTEYFTQIIKSHYHSDALLDDLIQHLEKTVYVHAFNNASSFSDDKEIKPDCVSKKIFVYTLTGIPNSKSPNCLLKNDPSLIEHLFYLDNKLMHLIQRFLAPSHQHYIISWYKNHATPTEKKAFECRQRTINLTQLNEHKSEKYVFLTELQKGIIQLREKTKIVMSVSSRLKDEKSQEKLKIVKQLHDIAHAKKDLTMQHCTTLINNFKTLFAKHAGMLRPQYEQGKLTAKNAASEWKYSPVEAKKDKSAFEKEWRERAAKVKALNPAAGYREPSASVFSCFVKSLEKVLSSIEQQQKTKQPPLKKGVDECFLRGGGICSI